jgi:hypothetical protein
VPGDKKVFLERSVAVLEMCNGVICPNLQSSDHVVAIVMTVILIDYFACRGNIGSVKNIPTACRDEVP